MTPSDAVPLIDLRRSLDSYRSDATRAFSRVLESQHFILGEEVQEIRSRAATRQTRPRVTGLVTRSGLRIHTPIVVNASGPHSAMVNLLAHAPLALTTAPLARARFTAMSTHSRYDATRVLLQSWTE